MRTAALTMGLAAATVLAACNKAPTELAADPIERAATCGVVAAAQARAATAKGDLPVEAQGRIFHYSLLAGSEGEVFDAAKAEAAVKRQPEVDEAVATGWQALAPQCAAAYPATSAASPSLPEARADAQLQCYMLEDYMVTALRAQGKASYDNAIVRYVGVRNKLDDPIGKALGGLSPDALKERRNRALAAAAKLGPPIAVLDACVERFG